MAIRRICRGIILAPWAERILRKEPCKSVKTSLYLAYDISFKVWKQVNPSNYPKIFLICSNSIIKGNKDCQAIVNFNFLLFFLVPILYYKIFPIIKLGTAY